MYTTTLHYILARERTFLHFNEFRINRIAPAPQTIALLIGLAQNCHLLLPPFSQLSCYRVRLTYTINN